MGERVFLFLEKSSQKQLFMICSHLPKHLACTAQTQESEEFLTSLSDKNHRIVQVGKNLRLSSSPKDTEAYLSVVYFLQDALGHDTDAGSWGL